MKLSSPMRFALAVTFAGSICLSGCSSMHPAQQTTSPARTEATVAYAIGSVDTAVKSYSIVNDSNASPISTLTYPESYYGGPLATDSSGQLYVAIAQNPINPDNLGDIYIYPPNSTGAATPTRIVEITTYDVSALSIDSDGLLYVAMSPLNSSAQTIAVYSATASGKATPLRTLELANFTAITDIAIDAAKNLYVAGYGAEVNAIAVYPPTATGSDTPDRVITFENSNVYGVAVDTAGDVFASVCPDCTGTSFVLEEFAPGANGAAAPVNTINLPIPSGMTGNSPGPVRFDRTGNIFTTLHASDGSHPAGINVLFRFAPTATSNTAPDVQMTPADGYNTFFAVN